MRTPADRDIDIGITLHIREWAGTGPPFVLLHGLASNARLWDEVGAILADAGHHVVAVDQRGHGLSDTPDDGYDFDTIADDLARLVRTLELQQPYIAGQSWGGNVVLTFAATHPGLARGFAFVDGGYLDLQGEWKEIAERLRPPALAGIPYDEMRRRIKEFNPDLDENGIDAIMGNFERHPDDTIRPHLTLDRHMTILRHLWQQNPQALYEHVQEPVLICVADDGNEEWTEQKRRQVAAAKAGLARVDVRWFHDTPHDIHLHRPAEMAGALLAHDEQINRS